MWARDCYRWALLCALGALFVAGCDSTDNSGTGDGGQANGSQNGPSDGGGSSGGENRDGGASGGDEDGGSDGGSDDGGASGTIDPATCGNLVRDLNEECDDGNEDRGDGCYGCLVEDGFSCPTFGAACDECGDGILQALSEDCDDGNRDGGDGCDASCRLEGEGWQCSNAGEPCELCGNGVLEDNERCDDGNRVDGDGCSANCYVIAEHYGCPEPGESCELCGNGSVGLGEVCDDGNTDSGDGCTFNCKNEEAGYVCPATGGVCASCGDGLITSGLEQCDDGNIRPGDGCNERCQKEPGALCTTAGSLCFVCGNGFIEPIAVDDKGTSTPDDDEYTFEACDDGNRDDGDGCSSTCEKAEGYSCPIPGYACNLCGDGKVTGLEACDDGPVGGVPSGDDGCSADCRTIEPDYLCPVAGDPCEKCGDGTRDFYEECDDGARLGGDGCSRNCKVEDGWVCRDSGAAFEGCSLCGDGKVELDEVCDDNNEESGDGCLADCSAEEEGFNCFFQGFPCAPCGDGTVQPGETCDEGPGNLTAGCDESCHIVEPWVCIEEGKSCELCGDGLIGLSYETCDDHNSISGDGCSSTCDVEPGWTCGGGSCLAAACGDGFRAGSEGCDDGNELSGDGCSTACAVERGYVCSDTGCRKTVCGDTVVEGEESCDDGPHCDDGSPCDPDANVSGCEAIGDGLCVARSGDGCADDCTLELGFTCPDPGKTCRATVCGDGFVEGSEQCDAIDGPIGEGGSFPSGCDSATCQLVPGNACDEGERYCRDPDSNSALEPCTSEITCGDGDCSALGGECRATVCGDGKVEGTEECDDGAAPGVCRGGTNDGGACSEDAECTGGGSCLDGCTSSCTVKPLYGCENDPDGPSFCRPILELVAVRRFTVANISPDSLVFDPARRSFIGYKSVDSQVPIELCLDGTLIKEGVRQVCLGGSNDGAACASGSDCASGSCGKVVLGTCAGGDNVGLACVQAADCPSSTCVSGWVPGAQPDSKYSDGAYDPFTGHTLFLDNGVLTDLPLCDRYAPGCASTGVPAGTTLESYRATIGDAKLEGVTVGTDGNLYAAYHTSGTQEIRVYMRRRVDDAIYIPSCTTAPEVNCTTFETTPALAFPAPVGSGEQLRALFTVPGEYLVGTFNHSGNATLQPAYTGYDELGMTTVSSQEYFRFFEGNGTLYGQSALPGFLFDLGSVGTSHTKYAQSAETAARGGAFVMCPNNASEPCQLFARVCDSDADCAAIFPGTTCNVGAPVPYCSAPGRAVDDRARVSAGIAGTPIDVLANDSLSESACADPNMKVISLSSFDPDSNSTSESEISVTTRRGGTATITNDGADVTYDAPGDATRCGFIDTFDYTADLGGGVIDDATVRVVVECDCGDGIKQSSEQCDLGDAVNGPEARCSAECTLNVICGDSHIDPGEQCDDNNSTSGDGCSALCTLESVCGDGVTEGAEQCDPEDPEAPLGCRDNCTVPSCGDGVVDIVADSPEQCDDGVSNGVYPAPCSEACTINSVCGDGAIQGAEQCDDGAANGTSSSTCNISCQINAACGNGIAEPGEECDASVAMTQCGGHACQADRCICENYCGDGRVGGLEECDDGNDVAADACRGAEQSDVALECTEVRCGDGVLDTHVFDGHPAEQCDDGNTNPSDGCTNACKKVVVCGDGTRTDPEECDDGNNVSGDGCSSSCKDETTVCGDGNPEPPEECDDGALNGSEGSSCTTGCRFKSSDCGNGTLESGEQCDDGNRASGDGCDIDCGFEGCGDGVIVPGEACDDGNRTAGDGCSPTCALEIF